MEGRARPDVLLSFSVSSQEFHVAPRHADRPAIHIHVIDAAGVNLLLSVPARANRDHEVGIQHIPAEKAL